MPPEIKKKTEFVVRAADVFDVPGMVKLQRAAIERSWRGIIGEKFDAFLAERLDPAEQAEKYRQRLHDPQRFLLVVEDAGGIAGFGGARACTAEDLPRGYGWQASAFYVAPVRAGQGAGKALFSGILEALRARGAKDMALWCLEGNAAARRFYERNGGILIADCETPEDYAAVAPHVAYGWVV